MEERYSVLVVDDEPTILQGMVETYDWHSAGFSVLDTASSGEAALEKAAQRMPDVIVADIRMKNMDGLELIRRVQALSDSVECVVVSAYKDFTYAQTACELGAFSYLLKPFSDDEFFSVMDSLRAYLDKKRAQGRMLELFQRHRDDILVQQLRGYLIGGVDEGTLRQGLSRMQPALGETDRFCCICADVDATTEIFLGDAPGHRYVQYRLLIDAVSHKYPCYHFDLPDNRLLLIVRPDTAEDGVAHALSEIMEKLAAQGYAFYAACGELVEGLGGLRRSFEQCMAGIELTYERDSDHLILYRSERQTTVSHYLYPKNKELEVLGALKAGQYDELERKVAEFQDMLEGMRAGGPFVHGCYQLLCLNIQFLLFQLYDIEEEDLEVYANLLASLGKLDKGRLPSTLRYAILDVIRNCEERAVRRIGNTGSYVQTAIGYMEDNLERPDLSIVEVADSLHLNAVYFGRMFKGATGKSFREFLLTRRLEQAKVLLTTTDRSVTEIALAVGMENLSYFSSQFKKYAGVLPRAYRGASL